MDSPSFGLRPAFPWNITACDSKNVEKNPGAYTLKLSGGTAKKITIVSMLFPVNRINYFLSYTKIENA